MLRAATTVEDLGPVGPSRVGAAKSPPRHRGELTALHVRGVGEVLDTSFELLRSRFAALVLLCAGLALPARLLETLSGDMRTSFETWSALVSVAVALGVQGVATALVTLIVYGQMQGRPVRALASLGQGLRRTPSLVLLTLIIAFSSIAGFLCCVVPSVVLTWLFYVAPAALVLEGLSPLQALRRSARLVKGSFPRWVALVVLLFVLVLPFTNLPTIVLDRFGSDLRHALGLGELSFVLLALLTASLLTGLGTALAAVVGTLFYIDLRVRSEGFDLVMRLERLRVVRPGNGGRR